MVSVTNKPIMVSVVRLNAVAPKQHNIKHNDTQHNDIQYANK